jgi:hypothetical protein
MLDALHTTGRVHSLQYEGSGVRVSASAPRHLVGKLKPFLVEASGAAAGAAAREGETGAAFAQAVFEDARGDGSLWVESSSGWSDEEEEDEDGSVDGGGGAWMGAGPSGRGAGGEGGEEGDPELAAARRQLMQLEVGKSGAAGKRRRRGGAAAAGGGVRQGLFSQ